MIPDTLTSPLEQEYRHQKPDGSFYNPFPTWYDHGFRDMLKWGFSDKPDIPDQYELPWVNNDMAFLQSKDSSLTITWIGHATFLITMDGKTILTDPFFSDRASPVQWAGPRRMVPPAIPLDKLPNIDYAVISHNHYDHLDYNSVRYLAEHGTAFYVPLGMDEWFRSHGMTNVHSLDWWDSLNVGDLTFSAVPAQHFCARTPFARNKVLWCGWVLSDDQQTIYFAGDTGYFKGFTDIGKRFPDIDVALLPIGAYNPRWFMKPVHLNPEDAVKAFRDLNASYAIAMHWGTIKLTDEPMDEPPQRLRTNLHEHHIPRERFKVFAFGETQRYIQGHWEEAEGGPGMTQNETFTLP